jgi:hypothetical protein
MAPGVDRTWLIRASVISIKRLSSARRVRAAIRVRRLSSNMVHCYSFTASYGGYVGCGLPAMDRFQFNR